MAQLKGMLAIASPPVTEARAVDAELALAIAATDVVVVSAFGVSFVALAWRTAADLAADAAWARMFHGKPPAGPKPDDTPRVDLSASDGESDDEADLVC